MVCRKSKTNGSEIGVGKPSGGGYATEEDCLKACQEGACCEAGGCSVKPQCKCQGAGKTFLGVGTKCKAAGACCVTAAGVTTCSLKTECECQAAGGTYLGEGTTCSGGACGICNCESVSNPTTVVWSMTMHKADNRPYMPPDYDFSIYGAPVKNGYKVGGQFTLAPVDTGGGIWEAFDSAAVPTTDLDYILTPAQDPSPRGGDYLRIPPTMTATVSYTRCQNGTYGHNGPHLSISVSAPRGTWNTTGGYLSDEDRINNVAGGLYGDAPSFTTSDGRKWENITDPDCKQICGGPWVHNRKFSIINEASPTKETLYFPYYDFTISVSGCQATKANPLP